MCAMCFLPWNDPNNNYVVSAHAYKHAHGASSFIHDYNNHYYKNTETTSCNVFLETINSGKDRSRDEPFYIMSV